jgi:serine/threonine protein kinase
VDIWSIGALLSWLLFGKKWLIELENHSKNQAEHKTVIHCPEKTPTWLMRILNNMLAYNPNDRFSMKDVTMAIPKAIACSETIASIMD